MSQYFTGSFPAGTTYNTSGGYAQPATQPYTNQTPMVSQTQGVSAYSSAVSTARPNSYATANPNALYSASQNSAQQYAYSAAVVAAATQQPQTYETNMYQSGFFQPQQQPQQNTIKALNQAVASAAAARFSAPNASVVASNAFGNKKFHNHNQRNNFYKKGTFKPRSGEQSVHYCEICKISCAGPQTYKEHLEGQKHKKREAASQQSVQISGRSSAKQLRCELCDVTCTGVDAYSAHIRGTKHEKTLKLHQKLGKPIPSAEPVVLTQSGPQGESSDTKKQVTVVPKISFVASSNNKTLNTIGSQPSGNDESDSVLNTSEIDLSAYKDKDVAPVGFEYIETYTNEQGKMVNFHCKLCDCKFNDPNAKEMHLKGRRHRLQYKKKVDPSLHVEAMPSMNVRKKQAEKLKKQQARMDFWHKRNMEDRMREMQLMEFANYAAGQGMRHGSSPGNFAAMRQQQSIDDKHVIAKHSSIYPTEEELQAVQKIVTSCERALKQVGNTLAETSESDTNDTNQESENKNNEEKKSPLRGVMRVGSLAKGLLLHGDLNVDLVLLSGDCPTTKLLNAVCNELPKQMETIAKGKYSIQLNGECIQVTSTEEPLTNCNITLTSPSIRETGDSSSEPVPDALDKSMCLEALASLRHAKWFQAKASNLSSCVMIIRILRDLCQRVPTWSPLNHWAMELLVEHAISSDGTQMQPGGALRRLFECIASGILLPGSPGLQDPCEKETIDALSSLSPQEREDITASAQHALRLMAFNQIHKVLDMDPIPAKVPNKDGGNNGAAKRPASDNETDGASVPKQKKTN